MSELIVDKVTAKIIQSDTYNITNTALNVGNTTQSLSTSTGSITTLGGLGILGNANIAGNGNIGGSATIGGGATIGGDLTISNSTQSTNTSTGSITTSGGIGIVKNANIGGNTIINGYLDINSAVESSSTSTGSITTSGGIGVAGNAYIGRSATIGGVLDINSGVASSSTSTGSITTSGGIGILGSANIGGTLTVGNFTTGGNVSPRTVLQRGPTSVVGRMVSLYIAATPRGTYYSSTPLDAGVWEIHMRAAEDRWWYRYTGTWWKFAYWNGGQDEDSLLVYHTLATVTAGKYLTFKLTGVKGTASATGFQYRLQTSPNSTLQSDTSQGAWINMAMNNTVTVSTNLQSDPIALDGIGDGLVGFPPSSYNNVISFMSGYAKRIA